MLGRAHHLAKLIGRDDLQQRATERIIEAASASLDDADPKPGVALRLMEVLVDAKCPDPAVDGLLVRARERYPIAWHVASIIDLERRRAPDVAARTSLDRELVQLWLDEAGRVDPLVALLHREKAARLARERGLPDLADKAAVAMQSAESPKLASIQVEVPEAFTREEIEEYIDSLVGDEDWWDSVIRMLSVGPPTGDVNRNRKQAAELAQEFPLQGLMPKVRLGGDGLPRYSPSTHEQKLDDQLTDVETMALQMQGRLLAEVMRRSLEVHAPTQKDIVGALKAIGCRDETSSAIARAVLRFGDGDPEAAAHTALPLVERLARELLLTVDAPLYRVQRNNAPGTYPGLGALLPALSERGLDESWYRFLRTFLSAANGWNFRNEVSHGFIDDIGTPGAALVLVAVLYLANLRPVPQEGEQHGPVDEPEAPAAG